MLRSQALSTLNAEFKYLHVWFWQLLFPHRDIKSPRVQKKKKKATSKKKTQLISQVINNQFQTRIIISCYPACGNPVPQSFYKLLWRLVLQKVSRFKAVTANDDNANLPVLAALPRFPS